MPRTRSAGLAGKTILCAAVLAAVAVAAPFVTLLLPENQVLDKSSPFSSAFPKSLSQKETVSASPSGPTAAPAPALPPIVLWDTAVSQAITVPMEEYLVGCAACELPISWPDEAFCAQMVASHSYALYRADHPSGTEKDGAAFSVNTAQCTGYTTKAVLSSRWGDAFAANYVRLQQLARRVLGEVITYDGEPAAAAYHAISCGHTEDSGQVWNESLPYLCGVESEWDKDADGFSVTIQYSTQQFYDALVMNLALSPESDPETWLGSVSWDPCGYVSSLELAGQTVSGVTARRALSLRSACFAIAYADGMFTITTRGYGHGVGMSQTGACAMARRGESWRDILAWYFPGTTVAEIGR